MLDNQAISSRLSELRKGEKLSQPELADRLAMPLRTYQSYERGQREVSATLLCALTDVFQIDPRWVLFGPDRFPMRGTHIPLDVLSRIVEEIETELVRSKAQLSPKKKAELIVRLYRRAVERKDVDENLVKDAVAFAK